jgi:class 3 adenylate cyclase/tetratricopeptide (TPR) repeat protein
MEIGAWLRGLGLERYEPAFRENEIDWEALPKLTAEDLKDLGVVLGGHRRRLLGAIAALSTAEAPPPTAAPASVGEAERRQLTVMFCDLVGSTPLSTRYDPEDPREIVGAYHRCVADTVGRFAGFVAKYMGDGVLVYFGYPEAHEDDAERAIRGGLAVMDAVGKLVISEPLNVRLGVSSGLVVVGDLIGAGAAQERGVVGETPNLAARLQALAQPGTLVIADSTRRQISGLFELDDLGPQPLPGFIEPQQAWRVLGESGVVSRFEALRSGSTPLVGRDEELDLLLRRWRQAKVGEGRVVLISGEPGIGKSRLTAELSQRIEGEPHTRLRYFCSPHHQDSALHPFITQLERAAGFEREDTTESKLGKLQALLSPGTPGDDEIELLAELLSLPNTAADLNLSPQRKRVQLFEALLHQLEALARNRPVMMALEDAHWIDPTSRELLDLTLNRVSRLPVLLIVTFRPEFQHVWSGRPHVTVMALNRLGGHDGAALVERLAGNAGLAREIADEIVERADGVPLFVEELTKAVLESGEPHNRVAAVMAASPLPALSIPAALHASLIARLDRLGPIAKEIAQIGAVLGREFGYDLIEPVAQRPAAELRTGLDRLTEAELVFCRGVAPHSSYLFKHALVQDAAYSTLLRASRQQLHARVATVLERDFADLVDGQPELLAFHLTAAGAIERAVDQWLRAGQHAVARLAYLEAIRHFERGLAAAATLPEGAARYGREIELPLARGLSFFTAEGFRSAKAAQAYARARHLAEGQGNAHQLFVAVYGLWQSADANAQGVECRRLSNRLLRLTRDSAGDGLRLQAHHAAWPTCLRAGEPIAARDHCDEGRRLYDPDRHRSHRLLYGGHDPGVCARYIGAQVYWLLGYPEQSLVFATEALEMAEHIGHPLSFQMSLVYNARLHLDRGEPEMALQRLGTVESLVAEQRLGLFEEPQILRGAALVAHGALNEAVVCLREGLARRAGDLSAMACLATALTRRGDHAAALATAKEGLKTQEEMGRYWLDAELHRLEGIALCGLNELDESQNALEDALRIARRQQAKAYELRAATSLARLWGEQGRRTEARDLLAPVYGWFTEGFDTADLKEAKALLGELA